MLAIPLIFMIYDGGDCDDNYTNTGGSSGNNTSNCNVPNPDYIGDGVCDDDYPYYTAACDYDGGDCDY